MHTTTIDHLEAEAERTAGILEDRHDFATDGTSANWCTACGASQSAWAHQPAAADHPTTQARRLADVVIANFRHDTPGHWQLVASTLTDDPAMLDSFATQHGLPRPTDAVKAVTIALIGSQALAASLSPIPPAADRPVCVLVGWLAEHPGHAAQMEYLDGHMGDWRPCSEAIDTIDAGWPVEVRQIMTVVGA